MAARKQYQRGELFRRYHLPVTSAGENDSESEEINVIDESQAEDRPVKEAEVRGQTTSVTKTKSQKRKASATSTSIITEKKSRKFSWTPESVEALLKYTKEYKTKCEFSCVDFEVDLQSLYSELRQCMAIDNPEDFGPEVLNSPGAEVKDMDTAEYNAEDDGRGKGQSKERI